MAQRRKVHPFSVISDDLTQDGWRTPDTYGNDFEMPPEEPAVYLFFAFDLNMERFFVAYVGMSMDVRKRWAAHPTLRTIRNSGWRVRRLFKRVAPEMLRETERHYIQKFNPPWNLAGRKRGVML